jgi:hypothetical protein
MTPPIINSSHFRARMIFELCRFINLHLGNPTIAWPRRPANTSSTKAAATYRAVRKAAGAGQANRMRNELTVCP